MTTSTSTSRSFDQPRRSDWAVALPRRFDTHRRAFLDHLEPVPGEILEIDGSAVDFADHAAIAALIAARIRFLDADADIRIGVMSDALRITLELTGDAPLLEHADLVERLEVT